MKKLIMIAVLALLGTGTFAQTSKGTIVVSGDVSFDVAEEEQRTPLSSRKVQSNTVAYSISPGIGYFIKDNLKVGAYIGYSNSKTENEIFESGTSELISKREYNNYHFGAYITKYFMLTDNFALTATGSVSLFDSDTEETSSADPDYRFIAKTDGLRISAIPGITYFPTDKIGISASFGQLSYTRQRSIQRYHASTSAYNRSSNLDLDLSSSTLLFGFAYHFNR